MSQWLSPAEQYILKIQRQNKISGRASQVELKILMLTFLYIMLIENT